VQEFFAEKTVKKVNFFAMPYNQCYFGDEMKIDDK